MKKLLIALTFLMYSSPSFGEWVYKDTVDKNKYYNLEVSSFNDFSSMVAFPILTNNIINCPRNCKSAVRVYLIDCNLNHVSFVQTIFYSKEMAKGEIIYKSEESKDIGKLKTTSLVGFVSSEVCHIVRDIKLKKALKDKFKKMN